MDISDPEILQQLFAPTNPTPPMLADVQWAYAQDINNGAYGNGQIKFRMTAQSEIRDMHNAYLSIPIHIESYKRIGVIQAPNYYGVPGVAATEWNLFDLNKRPKICFKGDVSNIIQGVVFSTDKGTNMVNEAAGQTIPINNFRRDIEHNQLYAEGDGTNVLYKMDEFPYKGFGTWTSGGSGGYQTTPVSVLQVPYVWNGTTAPNANYALYLQTGPYEEYLSPPSGSTTAAAQVDLIRNPWFNPGFKKKVDDLYNKAVLAPTDANGTGTGNVANCALEMDLIIPLRSLHDLFMQWRLPSVNIGFDLTFNIPWAVPNQTSAYYPIMGDGLTPPPSIRIGNQSQTPCRLFYRQCTLSAADNTTFGRMLEQTFVREIKFTTTDITENINFAPTTTNYQETINQSVVNPQRVIGILKTPTADSSAYAYDAVSLFNFQTVNIDVNNQPLFIQPFTGDYMQYQVIREQMLPETASALTYQTWKFMKRYCVFDLTRMGNRLTSPGTAVSLRVNGIHRDLTQGGTVNWSTATGNAAALTAVWLVESKSTLVVNYSKSGVQIVVGKYNRQA